MGVALTLCAVDVSRFLPAAQTRTDHATLRPLLSLSRQRAVSGEVVPMLARVPVGLPAKILGSTASALWLVLVERQNKGTVHLTSAELAPAVSDIVNKPVSVRAVERGLARLRAFHLVSGKHYGSSSRQVFGREHERPEFLWLPARCLVALEVALKTGKYRGGAGGGPGRPKGAKNKPKKVDK